MSVTGFEDHTKDLNEAEMLLVDDMRDAFTKALTLQPIKSEILEYKINYSLHERSESYRIGGAKLRKWTNYLRSAGILPIMANSQGYFISYANNDIESQVKSLRERANSINAAADGLERFLK